MGYREDEDFELLLPVYIVKFYDNLFLKQKFKPEIYIISCHSNHMNYPLMSPHKIVLR